MRAVGLQTRTDRLSLPRYPGDRESKTRVLALQALRRLLMQGALRVALVAITTAGVFGFLSLIPRNSQSKALTSADVKEAPSGTCLPSQCRAKPETGPRREALKVIHHMPDQHRADRLAHQV